MKSYKKIINDNLLEAFKASGDVDKDIKIIKGLLNKSKSKEETAKFLTPFLSEYGTEGFEKLAKILN